jgi:hypothetical protein
MKTCIFIFILINSDFFDRWLGVKFSRLLYIQKKNTYQIGIFDSL